MKPQKENLSPSTLHSFRVKHTVLPYLDSPWHYHPDYELIYIIKGEGKRFVGDSIENFYPEDMVFMGPNLPHVWQSAEKFYQPKNNLESEVIVIQFKEDSLGKDFFQLPEMQEIQNVLLHSKKGLKISGNTHKKIKDKMWQMVQAKGLARLTILLEILQLLVKSKNLIALTSHAFENVYHDSGSERMTKVFEFISENLKNDIQLEQVANIANMSKTAFCRYFKVRTTKSFLEYLTDARISYACKLLIENKLSISEIGYECGFNSPSYFNRKFKAVVGETPSEYYNKYNLLNSV